jgi:hypothetical protein
MKLAGGCFCGALRYRVTGDPVVVCHCHCLHCRRISGAAFVTWAEFRTKDFAFTQGTPAEFQSRPGVTRTFCAQCGTPVTYRNANTPRQVDLTACSLDRPEKLEPGDHLFCDRLLPWIHLDDGLPRHSRARAAAPRRPRL